MPQSNSPTNLERLRALRDEIQQIARDRKASNIRVFGSVVVDAATGASDVDFLVTMAADATLIDLIGLEQDLEALLEVSVYVVTEDAVHPRMAGEVQRTAIHL